MSLPTPQTLLNTQVHMMAWLYVRVIFQTYAVEEQEQELVWLLNGIVWNIHRTWDGIPEN